MGILERLRGKPSEQSGEQKPTNGELEQVKAERDQLRQDVADRDAELEQLRQQLEDPEALVDRHIDEEVNRKVHEALSAMGLSADELEALPAHIDQPGDSKPRGRERQMAAIRRQLEEKGYIDGKSS